MRVLGIVPARGGSKRLPRKNVRVLAGKPLVAWSIEAALAAKSLTRVCVSSDDSEVLAIAGRYADVEAIVRPPELATDRSPAIDYVHHALEHLAGEAPYDAIAIIQPTSPFTTGDDIDGTIELLRSTGAPSAVSVMKLDHAIHPAKLKVMTGDRLAPYLEEERGRMAAHELPDVYVRNCSVYVARRANIDAGQIIDESDCRGFVMPLDRSVDINEDRDFAFCEFLIARRRGSAGDA